MTYTALRKLIESANKYTILLRTSVREYELDTIFGMKIDTCLPEERSNIFELSATWPQVNWYMWE